MFPTPEEHTFWHIQNGPREEGGCPWDCYDPAMFLPPEPEEGEGVRCGHCKGRHWSIEELRQCSVWYYENAPAF